MLSNTLRHNFLATLVCLLLLCSPSSSLLASTENLYQEALIAISEGNAKEAENKLKQLLEHHPLHAGAYLDLALLYCAIGNQFAAESLFEALTLHFSPPEQILEIIAAQRASACGGVKPKHRSNFRLTRGHESNVNQGARNPNFSIGSGSSLIELVLLPEFQPKSDSFTSITAEYSRQLTTSLLGTLVYHNRLFDVQRPYNMHKLELGLEQTWQRGDWITRGMASSGLTVLNNRLYLKQHQLHVALTPAALDSTPWQTNLLSGISLLEYPLLDNFNAYIWETRATLSYRKNHFQWQAMLGHQTDYAAAARPGGHREGTTWSLAGKYLFGEKIFVEAGVQEIYWQSRKPFLPGFIDRKRKQQLTSAHLATTLKLDADNALTAALQLVSNRENISVFAYQNRILQVSWQFQFSR